MTYWKSASIMLEEEMKERQLKEILRRKINNFGRPYAGH